MSTLRERLQQHMSDQHTLEYDRLAQETHRLQIALATALTEQRGAVARAEAAEEEAAEVGGVAAAQRVELTRVQAELTRASASTAALQQQVRAAPFPSLCPLAPCGAPSPTNLISPNTRKSTAFTAPLLCTPQFPSRIPPSFHPLAMAHNTRL